MDQSGDNKTTGDKWNNPLSNIDTLALIAYIIFVVLSSIFILTPLEVMTTRLTIQVRYPPLHRFDSVSFSLQIV